MDEWLSTITNETLRQEVKNSLLVSGGSICSLFLNEEVNDYDVYIQDMNVAHKLALYYYPNSDNVLDGRKKDQYLEKFHEAQHNYEKVACENLHDNQIKLMVGVGERTTNEEDGTNKFLPMFFSSNAISLSDKVQIVLRFTGDVEQIHSTFDFRHATNYFTFKDGLVTNLAAMESIITKQLLYQGSLYPLTTIIRIKKFTKRNWNINAGEMLKVMFQISELDLTNHHTLEEQLMGVDVAYFGKIVEILKNKQDTDPTFKLTSSYLNVIIDKVFNDEID